MQRRSVRWPGTVGGMSTPRPPRHRTAFWIRTTSPREHLQRALAPLSVIAIDGDHGEFAHLVYDVDRWHADDNADTHASLVANLRSVLTLAGIGFEPAIGQTLEPLPLQLPSWMRVVVVDDRDNDAQALAEYLNLRGHRAVASSDGAEGLRLILETRPDAALLDLDMPGIAGVEICRQVRNTPTVRDTVLVAVTGHERDAITSRGFDAHLLKPVLPTHLERRVLQLVARRRHLAGDDSADENAR